MSKKQKSQVIKKVQRFSNIGAIIKSLPAWLKFAGLLVPILGLLISYLNYTLDRQNFSDNTKVLVSTDSNLNVEAGKINAYPPSSISFLTKTGMTCGRSLVISNIGGISTALVGLQGQFSHTSFPQSIKFETIGNEVYLAGDSNSFPKGLFSFRVTILNDSPWLLTNEIFKDTDILAFPFEVQSHSSIKVRVVVSLNYKSEEDASFATSQFDEKGNPKISLQFLSSTSKITEPVEFECFDGILFSQT